MVVVGSAVVAFTILVEWHVLRISWLDAIKPHPLFSFFYPPIIFNYHILEKYLDQPTWAVFLYPGCAMISFGGIVVSIVATIGNWQTNKFDSLTPSTQLTFPF